MLPAEERIADIRKALNAGRDVVFVAPPGSGKTTTIPLALMNEPFLAGKNILMLEPRRIAARSCATYMAGKLGEEVGGHVGYQVRLEKKISAATKLEIVTEGLLTQRILADPELSGVGLIIFDEFHERSLACDLGFALALETARALRDDLRLMVMSATIDAGETAALLGSAETIHAEGRMFPVETVYLGDIPVSAAISRALKETDGDILVFLPGEGEILRTMEAICSTLPSSVEVLPLYGAMPKDEQDKIFLKSTRRKVILSTSIAETSLTIDSISCVIDSGLMRVPRFSPSRGMSGLVTLPLSLDRAEQRRGRAGRTRAGTCYRLWNEAANWSRPQKMNPEILDADLASLVLTSFAWGAAKRESLSWPTPPPASSWDQAVNLLKELGAIDGERLTSKGEKMARLPMHPRLANMMVSSGGGEKAALLAAIIEEGAKSHSTDIREINPTRRIAELARRFAKFSRGGESEEPSEGALLAFAYPDRIAALRANGAYRMTSGKGAFLDQADPLSKSHFLVCCTLDNRLGDAKIFLASPIDQLEIESIFANSITETTICVWDRSTDRVKSVLRRSLKEMTIDERSIPPPPELASDAMLEGISAKGVPNLPCWTDSSRALFERIKKVWPEIDINNIQDAIAPFLSGCTKWKDLEKIDMHKVMDFMLTNAGHTRRELDTIAPPEFIAPTGSHIKIDYSGDEPVASVKLQECFGLMETPIVLGGKKKLVLALLSPAGRPVQVTKSLATFWKESYPLVRKEMRGRYPKHYWPEDPFTAIATKRTTARFQQ